MKKNQDNQIQNITLGSMYFVEKGYMPCTMGSGAKPPEAVEFSIIFVLKVTLQSARLLLTVSYGKMGEQDVLIGRPIMLKISL